MKRLTLLFFLITALTFGQEQEKKEDLETITNKEFQREEKEKSDQMMQAEAILNAIKGQEKINQKHKILKSKAYKYDKDW